MEADQAREQCEAVNGAAGPSGAVGMGPDRACQQARSGPERPRTALGVGHARWVLSRGHLVLELGVVGVDSAEPPSHFFIHITIPVEDPTTVRIAEDNWKIICRVPRS